MSEPLFDGAEEWMDKARRVLMRPGSLRELCVMGLDLEHVVDVARLEAAQAGPDGISRLTHHQLAESACIPTCEALLIRLFLIDLGLESSVIEPGFAGRSIRLLHQE